MDAWHVVGQRQNEKMLPGGGFQTVITVSFLTAGGTQGSVDIPKNIYSADAVKSAIDAYVEHLVAVEGLTG